MFTPSDTRRREYTGTVTVVPLTVGGDVKARNTSDFEFPVLDEPMRKLTRPLAVTEPARGATVVTPNGRVAFAGTGESGTRIEVFASETTVGATTTVNESGHWATAVVLPYRVQTVRVKATHQGDVQNLYVRITVARP